VRQDARARKNVSLVGIARTLLAAAGAPDDGLEGDNLLPVLLGETLEPARRPILVRHWHRGPVRAALMVDRRRLLLFNRTQPFEPDYAIEEHFLQRERRRLARFAAFDLARDPRQLQPPVPSPADIEAAYALLDPTLDGLRVVLRGLPEGELVEGSLRFAREPSGAMLLFLDDADDVAIEATTVRFKLGGETPPKGFLVLGDVRALESLEVRSTRTELGIELGEGSGWTGSVLPDARMRRTTWPPWSGRPGPRIWSRTSRALAPERPLDAETRATLQALGYL
jgi:hypothetical protein